MIPLFLLFTFLWLCIGLVIWKMGRLTIEEGLAVSVAIVLGFAALVTFTLPLIQPKKEPVEIKCNLLKQNSCPELGAK